MIVAHDLHRWYGRTHAVRGISLEIPSRQIVGLLGPNGAGKSTTIRMLAGVLAPDRGTMTLDGIDALRYPAKARRSLGYLPESAASYTDMSAKAFLAHRASIHGLSGKARRRAIERAAERCFLDKNILIKRVSALSKGYRQRVALAAAILHDPAVLILDEPTNGLDPTQLREARSLIGQLAEDRTVILCSHVLAEVERLCERVVIIGGGAVLADGTLDELRCAENGARCIAHARLSAEEARRRLAGVATEHDDVIITADEPGWCRVVVRSTSDPAPRIRARLGGALAGVEIRELRDAAVGLEDVFVRVLDAAADQPRVESHA